MKPSIQKLKKIFKLEAERKYDNHAVVGGLERMLDYWEPEARSDGIPEDLLQAIVARLRDYAHLTEKSRAEMLQGIWRRIQRSEAGLSTETPFDADSVAEQRPTENPTACPPERSAETAAPAVQRRPGRRVCRGMSQSPPPKSSCPRSSQPAEKPPARSRLLKRSKAPVSYAKTAAHTSRPQAARRADRSECADHRVARHWPAQRPKPGPRRSAHLARHALLLPPPLR